MDRLSTYRPSNTLRSLQSEVNRLFEDIFPTREGNGSPGMDAATWSPQLDVMETDGAYRLRVDLPGVSRDDVTINVENNRLTIRGERAEEQQTKNENVLRTERMRGRFFRSLTMPTEINPDKAKAHFEEGVLLIDLPKVAKSKAKSISIS